MKVKMESLMVFASSLFKWRVLERRLAFMRSPPVEHARTAILEMEVKMEDGKSSTFINMEMGW